MKTETILQQTEISDDMRQLLAEGDAYHAALYPAESNHMTSAADLLDDDFAFFIHYVDGDAVGCIGINRTKSPPEIKRLFVRERFRGHGYGRTLLAWLIEDSKARGDRLLQLETGVHQPESIGLYRSFGFVECPPIAGYSSDPLSLFFELSLSD